MIAPELTLDDNRTKTRNPWAWIPSLYFAQGIPYVMVMTVSVIMYKRLGVSNADITFYTGWLYLPWVLKPLWSPMVDLLGTKRRWIIVMQAVIAVTLAAVAFSLPGPRFFQYTLAFFWLMAFSSATHDIAADGFYMLGLQQHQQAAFVGVRSTFYRVATIAAQGLLVMLAGLIESGSGLAPLTLSVHVSQDAANSTIVLPAQIEPGGSDGPLALAATQSTLQSSTTHRNADEIKDLLAAVRRSNVVNGFAAAKKDDAGNEVDRSSWWNRHVSTPLGAFLRQRFGDSRLSESKGPGNLAVTALHLTAMPEAGRQIAVVLNHSDGDERVEVVEGGRLLFNEQNWNKPALVVFEVNPKIRTATEASFKATSGNIPLAWSTVAGLLTILFVGFAIYHKFALPRPLLDASARAAEAGGMLRSFFLTFVEFFRKQRMAAVIGFLLFFRFAEAQLVRLVSPFLLDPRDLGGLGLSTAQVGLAYGTIGVAALMLGGLLGGYLISRQGLRYWLWPMVIIMHTPDLAFVYLAYAQPDNLAIISAAVAIEQFGYGFGFTAYMLFMILVAEGEHKTAHYALCTGFMALGMMVPGQFSGWLQETIGYQHFFLWVLISTIPGFIVAALVSIPPTFGRKINPA